MSLVLLSAEVVGSKVLEFLLQRIGLWKTLQARRTVGVWTRQMRKNAKNPHALRLQPHSFQSAWIDKMAHNPVNTALWWTANERALFWNMNQHEILWILKQSSSDSLARNAILFLIHVSCQFPEIPGTVLEAVVRECNRHLKTAPRTVKTSSTYESATFRKSQTVILQHDDVLPVVGGPQRPHDLLAGTSSTRGSCSTSADTDNEILQVQELMKGIVSKTLMPDDVIAVSSVLLCVAQAIRREQWKADDYVSRAMSLAPEVLSDLDVRKAVFLTDSGLPLNAGLLILERCGLVSTTVEQKGFARKKTRVQFVASSYANVGVEIEHGPIAMGTKIVGNRTARMHSGRRIVGLTITRNQRGLDGKVRLA